MPKPDRPFTDEVLARAGLEAYEQYRLRRGKLEPTLWRGKLERAGVPLPPPPAFEPGDAYEGPDSPQPEIGAPGGADAV